MPFLDALIYGYRVIVGPDDGELPQRSVLQLTGDYDSVTDDSANARTVVSLGHRRGVGTQAMADANQTPTSTVYSKLIIKTTGAITANRNLTLPTHTDANAKIYWINNTCTGAFGVVVKDATAGTTVTVTNLRTCAILMDSRGATRITTEVA